MATQKQVFTEAHENIDKANHTTSGLIEYLRYIFGKLENASGGGGGGSEVSYTQTLTSGTETGTIEIDGVSTKMYAPTPTAPTDVEVTQVISTGTKIATISVDDVPTDIYAPAGGGIVRSVLWSNPNTSANFAAQNIVLNEALTNFDEAIIYYANSKSALFGFRQIILDPTASASAICACQFVGSGSNVYSRVFTYTDSTHIAVGDCNQSSTPGTAANDILLPVKIIGVKY